MVSTTCQYARSHNLFLMVYEFCTRWGTDQRSQSVVVVKDWLASLKSEHAELQNCIQHLKFQRFTHSGEGGLVKLQLTDPNDLSLGSGVDMTEFFEDHHSEKSNLCLLGDLLQSEETWFEDLRLVKTLIWFTVRVILGCHISWTFLWIWVATRHVKPSLSLIDSPMQSGPIGLRRKVRALKKRALPMSELWWTYHVEEFAVSGNPGRQHLDVSSCTILETGMKRVSNRCA